MILYRSELLPPYWYNLLTLYRTKLLTLYRTELLPPYKTVLALTSFSLCWVNCQPCNDLNENRSTINDGSIRLCKKRKFNWSLHSRNMRIEGCKLWLCNVYATKKSLLHVLTPKRYRAIADLDHVLVLHLLVFCSLYIIIHHKNDNFSSIWCICKKVINVICSLFKN